MLCPVYKGHIILANQEKLVNEAIVVATSEGRDAWLQQCLSSLGDLPYIVVSTDGFELGKLAWVYENTNLDRWFFLQDSIVIKKKELFDLGFSFSKSVAVSDCPVKFGMYLGIYTRSTLQQLGIPKTNNKEEAIHHEWCIAKNYCQIENDIPTLFPDFHDRNAKGTTMLFGRENLVLENDYLIKYKGTWR